MKKNLFAVLFSILLIASCLFASCNTSQSLFPSESESESSLSSPYNSTISELENRIMELQQMQYISNSENQAELERLQALLAELKGESKNPPTSESEQSTTDPSDTETETDPQEDAKFLYNIEGESAIITGYTGNSTHLVIPSHIDGYAVKGIGDHAFQSATLRSVVVTEGIETIGWFAFSECSSLSSITIPESVQSIGYSAFAPEGVLLTIYCPSNSFAHRYAQSYGISFAII